MGNETSIEARAANDYRPDEDEKKIAIRFMKTCDEFLNEVHKTTNETQQQLKDAIKKVEETQSKEEKIQEDVKKCNNECRNMEELRDCYLKTLKETRILPENF